VQDLEEAKKENNRLNLENNRLDLENKRVLRELEFGSPSRCMLSASIPIHTRITRRHVCTNEVYVVCMHVRCVSKYMYVYKHVHEVLLCN
jgi:hypothetical protein